MSRFTSPILALALAALASPIAGRAQVRQVVSKEVSVGSSEAALVLEFDGGDRLEISFEDGSVLVDGDVVGSFEPGGKLDATWRELLAQAVALDGEPLAVALRDWTVPVDLVGDAAEVAREIDQALDSAVSAVGVQANAGEPSVSLGDPGSLARLLLGSGSRLRLLDDALAGLDENVRVHVAEDVVVAADEVVEGNLVVIEGDARIEGDVEGDLVVVGGTLELLEGSSVRGEVRLADARLLRNEGTVGVDVVEVEDVAVDVDDEERARLRDEIREDIRDEIRDELRGEDDDDGLSISLMSPFRPIIRGVGGILENLVMVLILGLVGAAALAFAGDKVDVIAETARRSPGRSAVVGLAGTVLLIPAWVLGFVALLVSIVGIPVAIAWLPLFPLAACVAALVGYLAVARNTGEWLADSDFPWTHWIRKSNSLITMVGGLLGLMVLFMAANVISIAPFLGFLTGLLVAAGVVVTFLAVQIGFGAVLITRAGRRKEYARYPADEAWEAAMNVDVGGVDAEQPAEQPAGQPAEASRKEEGDA